MGHVCRPTLLLKYLLTNPPPQKYLLSSPSPKVVIIMPHYSFTVPSVGPSSVICEALNSTTVIVTWVPIAEKFRNGRLLGYKVYYRLTEQQTLYWQYKVNQHTLSHIYNEDNTMQILYCLEFYHKFK